MFLINLCVSFIALSVCFIISHYVMVNADACKAFSFFFHYTLLVSSGSIAIMVFFMIYAPYTGSARRIAFTTAITTNLCKFASTKALFTRTEHSALNCFF